ncbi:MAG: AAA family ATPase, partial [Lachnospiraceae bacterium]
MLLSLHVKNLALIDETEVFFGEGLNILTGETGAGKSIIIGSVNLALGARADKDMIRTGAEYALIELVFQVTDAGQRQMITQMEVPLEEDGTLLIQRKISATRNLCKIGGENATTKTVREVAELLMDIHGQHEHQSLFHIKKHMELLDDYAKTDLIAVKNRIQEQYGIYKGLKEESEQTNLDQAEQSRQLSLAQFEWEEIDNAGLVIGED